MPDGQLLEFSAVTKRFGPVEAVAGLSARVEPGQVTGFLGPNGAGKTTTLRILLGLVRPTSGTATIGGVPYARLSEPLREVGATLEASSFHPGRSAANHLLVYAHAARIPRSRVDEVLGLVGLGDVAGRKVGGFSLGMRQRLGLAYALLGDPGVLVLDEPANGLDPEGIRWMRGLLRTLAGEGRTVLVSSHLLAEVQQTVDALVILARGRLVFQGGIEELADPDDYATVVDAPDRAALVAALEASGLAYEVLRNGLTVRSAEPDEVGRIAAASGIALSSLQRRGAGLEDVFLDLVNGVRVHPSAGGAAFAAPEPVAAAAATVSDVGEGSEVGAFSPDRPTSAPTPTPDAEVEEVDAAMPGSALARVGAVAPDSAPAKPEDGAAQPEDAVREPPTATAAFAVAATGVIDIVPVASTEHPADDETDAPEPPPFDETPSFEPETDDVPAIVEPEHAAPFDAAGGPEPQPVQPGAPEWRPEAASPPTPEFADDAPVADATVVVEGEVGADDPRTAEEGDGR